MKVHIDSLVRGKAGSTDRIVEGRVVAMKATTTTLIGPDGRQWQTYDPEVIEGPRPLAARRDIPARFR